MTIDYSEYLTAKIVDIRKGSGGRKIYTYARIVSGSGELLVDATLEYCEQVLKERQELAKQQEQKSIPSNNR